MMNDFSTRMGAGAHLSLADEHPKAKSLHQLACDECVTNCVRCGWMGGWVGGRCVYVCVVVVVCVCGGGEAPPPCRDGKAGRAGAAYQGRPPRIPSGMHMVSPQSLQVSSFMPFDAFPLPVYFTHLALSLSSSVCFALRAFRVAPQSVQRFLRSVGRGRRAGAAPSACSATTSDAPHS